MTVSLIVRNAKHLSAVCCNVWQKNAASASVLGMVVARTETSWTSKKPKAPPTTCVSPDHSVPHAALARQLCHQYICRLLNALLSPCTHAPPVLILFHTQLRTAGRDMGRTQLCSCLRCGELPHVCKPLRHVQALFAEQSSQLNSKCPRVSFIRVSGVLHV